ncbi:MAG: glycosyltransferase family 39 protein [Microthrixaceae bacterium]
MSTSRRDERGFDRAVLRAVVGAATLVAVTATLVATRRGPGTNPDSANYLSAGLSLASGRGLTTFGGSTLTIFPPGLSTVVAMGEWVGIGAEWTVRILNSAAFAATVLMGFFLLRRHVPRREVVVAGTCLLAVSAPLLTMAEMTWTEPTFIALCLALVLILEQLLRSERWGRWLPAVVLVVGSAFLFRYAGVSLLVVVGATVLAGSWSRCGWLAATRRAAICTAASAAIPIAWMLRNHSIDGTLMGPRSPSVDGPVETAARFVATIGRWILPDPAPVVAQFAVGLLLAGCAAYGAYLALGRYRSTSDFSDVRNANGLTALVTFSTVYGVYLVAAQLTTAFDKIGNRLMSPLLPPVVVLVMVGVDRAWTALEVRRPAVAGHAVKIGLVILVAAHAGFFAKHAWESSNEGVGYSSRTWMKSELIRAVDDLPTGAVIYTNAPGGLWVGTGREPLFQAPPRRAYRSDVVMKVPEEFLRNVNCAETYLAWFSDIPGSFLFTPEELSTRVELDARSSSPDGTLFRLNPVSGNSGVEC